MPDLAADLPEVSEDGLTYTFTLKDGIMFGPPVSREITSKDFKYEFDRLANPDIGAFGYPLYYEVIKGFKEVADGKAKAVSGIETPDDKTIVFHLTKPAGDFLYRLAMAAAGPIPEEVAGCFKKAGDYGRYVITSGPYMIEGSDKLDISSCKTMKPISGLQPRQAADLRPQPRLRPGDGRPSARTCPTGSSSRSTRTTRTASTRPRPRRSRTSSAARPAKSIKEYTENPDLEGLLKANPDDRIFYSR